ncbi:MAG TPA: ATP-grasp domain-containing protein [Solirubrobacterales bacterium]|nr:ATP-grasp domain-containing protein [Solirubrobacterales bacterium]
MSATRSAANEPPTRFAGAAVVVDAYSTGAKLAPRFAAAGLPVVHVQSSPQMPEFYLRAFRGGDFVENVVHEGDLEATAARLASHDPAFVVVGSEPGVPLSDALSERLGLPSNGTELSRARRDKHAMAGALRAAGLRAVEELKTADPAEAAAWARERDQWPVVVKPLDSAGTDGVSLCEDPGAVEAAFAVILGRPNALQGANRELLVQEMLHGTQLFFNSISWDGVHHVSEIWQDNKRRIAGNLVYDYEELLPRYGEKQDQVAPYVEAVLDALGIRFGPAHTEVMLTADGPVLVESGARMHGSVRDDVIDRCTPSHPTVTAEAYLDPGSVAGRASQPYELREAAYCVMLISPHEGRIVSTAGLEEIERLPTFAGSIAMLEPGQQLRRTIDLFSCPGMVYLVDPDRGRLQADYERLRELETQGLFELEQLIAT